MSVTCLITNLMGNLLKLQVLNRQAVDLTVSTALALDCTIVSPVLSCQHIMQRSTGVVEAMFRCDIRIPGRRLIGNITFTTIFRLHIRSPSITVSSYLGQITPLRRRTGPLIPIVPVVSRLDCYGRQDRAISGPRPYARSGCYR